MTEIHFSELSIALRAFHEANGRNAYPEGVSITNKRCPRTVAEPSTAQPAAAFPFYLSDQRHEA